MVWVVVGTGAAVAAVVIAVGLLVMRRIRVAYELAMRISWKTGAWLSGVAPDLDTASGLLEAQRHSRSDPDATVLH